jgi:signal transduction histidine kinase
MSLRRRLIFWLVGSTIGLGLCAGSGVYFYVRHALLHEFDRALGAKAHLLGSLMRIDSDHPGKIGFDFADASMPEYLPGRRAEYFEMLMPGTVIERSRSMRDGDRLLEAYDRQRSGKTWDLSLPDGRTGRAFALLVAPHYENEDRFEGNVTRAPAPRTILVVVARDRADVDRTLATFRWGLGMAGLMLVGGGVLALSLGVTRALRPLDRLGARAAAVGPETLHVRFDVATMPAELRPICGRLNDLLERLDQAFRRERRLSADIAHELRTPIAELRTLSEVAMRWADDPAETTRYFQDVHEVALRMGKMIETLLALAHVRAGRSPLDLRPVTVRPMIDEALARRGADVRRRQLVVNEAIGDDVAVLADPLMTGRIVENLLDNAIDYTPAGGEISCTARRDGDGWTIEFANTVAEVSGDDVSRMFQPFWRKDDARSDGAHAGLGLSLVAEYAKAMGGESAARLVEPNRLAISLRMPAAPPAARVPEPAASAHHPSVIRPTENAREHQEMIP